MYYFYLLKSRKTGRFYKGHTEDVNKRLNDHNVGKTRSNRNGIPWEVIYTESFETREEAVLCEKYYKTLPGGKELRAKIKK